MNDLEVKKMYFCQFDCPMKDVPYNITDNVLKDVQESIGCADELDEYTVEAICRWIKEDVLIDKKYTAEYINSIICENCPVNKFLDNN